MKLYPVILSDMKTAVSIPDELFVAADKLARRRRVSRSELYASALQLLINTDDEVTTSLNAVYDKRVDGSTRAANAFVSQAARAVLARNEW